MSNNTWRERLLEAIEEKGMTLRMASLRAGMSASYFHTIMSRKQTPSIDSIIDITDKLDISPLWLLYNVKMDAETVQVIRHYQSLDPKRQKVLRDVLSAMVPGEMAD